MNIYFLFGFHKSISAIRTPKLKKIMFRRTYSTEFIIVGLAVKLRIMLVTIAKTNKTRPIFFFFSWSRSLFKSCDVISNREPKRLLIIKAVKNKMPVNLTIGIVFIGIM